jgi:hypothetical protein
MIPKGNQRAGGRQLATHLMNAYDNERVEIAEVRGAIAQDLHGAFAEWRAEAGATRCRKYLYSLSLNPDPAQGPLTRDQYLDFIARTENKLGLSEQPRAIVFHSKYGREHCHVVWSRIDTQKMKAVQLSHDHQKLRAVTREFARDHHLRLPPGLEKDHGKDRFAEQAKVIDLGEKQQEERTGVTKAELLSEITAAWKESDTGRSLVAALEQRGYLLARGDRRAYVVVDLYGEIHSVSRYIDGARASDVKARLKDYPIDKLPDAAKAQAFARQRRESLLQQQREAAPAAAHSQRAEALKKRQQTRRDELQKQKVALLRQHTRERTALKELQDAQLAGVLAARQQRQPTRLVAFVSRITGIATLIQAAQRFQDKRRAAEHQRQTDALRRRHARELMDFRRRARALAYVEKREARSLRTARYREENQSLRRGPEESRGAMRTEFTKRSTAVTREMLLEHFNQVAEGVQQRAGETDKRKPERDRSQDLTDKNLSKEFNAPAPAERQDRTPPVTVSAPDFPVPKLEPKAPLSARPVFDDKRRALLDRQAEERETRERIFQRWEASVQRERAQEREKGASAWIDRITGAQAKRTERERIEDAERHQEQQRQTRGQNYRHKQELKNLEHDLQAKQRLEQDTRTPDDPLAAALKRRQAQKQAQLEKEQTKTRKGPSGRDRGR